ncbi:hypothetical protein ACUN0C_11605 [Faunimonas sp. B44]|uniref:hypothetical protein n=1 Tax=Faunimonas sp. B44 TaxID=3461493 RepID=UPI004043A206
MSLAEAVAFVSNKDNLIAALEEGRLVSEGRFTPDIEREDIVPGEYEDIPPTAWQDGVADVERSRLVLENRVVDVSLLVHFSSYSRIRMNRKDVRKVFKIKIQGQREEGQKSSIGLG